MLKLFTFLAIVGLGSAINIDDLVSKMSVEEKCGQMTQIVIDKVLKYPNPDVTSIFCLVSFFFKI